MAARPIALAVALSQPPFLPRCDPAPPVVTSLPGCVRTDALAQGNPNTRWQAGLYRRPPSSFLLSAGSAPEEEPRDPALPPEFSFHYLLGRLPEPSLMGWWALGLRQQHQEHFGPRPRSIDPPCSSLGPAPIASTSPRHTEPHAAPNEVG